MTLRVFVVYCIQFILLGMMVSFAVATPPTIPELKFDLYNIKTPQLIGIIIGCIVFSVTIMTVIYLLYASGTLGRAWMEIANDSKLGGKIKKEEKIAEKAVSPFQLQPELYEHLLEAKYSLPINLDFPQIDSEQILLKKLEDTDIELLFEACNGSAQYHESAYEPTRLWAWADWGNIDNMIDNNNNNNINTYPWSSIAVFKKFLSSYSDNHFTHIVIIEKIYKKPIGLISLTNNSPKHLSINIDYIWITPAFQTKRRVHEAIYQLLDWLFFKGYRRVTAEVEERNIIARKLFQRCGFFFETILRKHKVIQNRNSNTAVYIVLNSDWQDVGPKLRSYANIPKKELVKAIEIAEAREITNNKDKVAVVNKENDKVKKRKSNKK